MEIPSKEKKIMIQQLETSLSEIKEAVQTVIWLKNEYGFVSEEDYLHISRYLSRGGTMINKIRKELDGKD